MAALPGALAAFLALPDAERVIGPYHLRRAIGQGAFAPVWLADEVFGGETFRTAAVKLFSFAGDNTADSLASTAASKAASNVTKARREQILEEARALCRLEHPNIVRFFALPTDDVRQIVGLAMEYVSGTPLDRTLHARQPAHLTDGRGVLTVDETLTVGIAVASALSAVHQAGLVHRDVKPANVIESPGGYKLIDFGIAAADERSRPQGAPKKVESAKSGVKSGVKSAPVLVDDLLLEGGPDTLLGRDETNIATASGESSGPFVNGTPGYIDPICLASSVPATAASDLYSLGAMLFECLFGRVPSRVDPERAADVMYGWGPAVSIALVAPHVPTALAKLIDRLLEATPTKRPRSAEVVVHELQRICQERVGRSRPMPPEELGPFRGLGRFEEEDRDVFFGRSAEVAATLELLRGRALVAVTGPSGSGKSSLMRAGVVPALIDGAFAQLASRMGGPKVWDRAIVSPGRDPYGALEAALAPFLGSSDGHGKDLVVCLADYIASTERGVLLVIDQLEELATISEETSRVRALDLLVQLSEPARVGLRVVVAIRRDLLDVVLGLDPRFGSLLARGAILVGPMSDASWAEVLDQAIEAYGYSFEDAALRGELLKDLAGTAGAMPLVQFALTQLWARRDVATKTIPRAAFVAIGGIAGALEQHADATLAELAALAPGLVDVARDVLLALTTPEGTRTFRTIISIRDVVEHVEVETVLERLEAARLVVREPEGFTLAHETLLTQWGKLRLWVSDAKEDRLLAELIRVDAARWLDGNRDEDLLWRGRRLLAAEDLRQRGTLRLSPSVDGFLTASRRAAHRGRVVGIAAVALVLVAALTGTIVSTLAARRAKQAKEEASQSEANAKKNERDAIHANERAAGAALKITNTYDQLMTIAANPRDKAKAFAFYQKTCDEGHLGGCRNLGLLYEKGWAQEGLGKKDEAKAVTLYEKACTGGNVLACSNLGAMVKSGRGIAKDEAKALTLYLGACNSGDAHACLNVGQLHERGHPSDVVKAMTFYQKACDGGETAGCANVEWIRTPGKGMLKIPGGTFSMGDEAIQPAESRKLRTVTVPTFWMDVTEVTVDAFATCVAAEKCDKPDESSAYDNWGKSDRGNHPVNSVDWNQAGAYCAYVGKRLPTEEEWEYAARGTDARNYPWGAEAPSAQLCWSGMELDGTKKRRPSTCPVGSYPKGASPFGLMDMAGNVWEWTDSKYRPSDLDDSADRAIRGGAWTDTNPVVVHSTMRSRGSPAFRSTDLGFRCVRQ